MGIFGKKKFTVWVVSDACWAVKKPRTDIEIVGIILPGSAVYVKKAKRGWLEVINGPVRDPEDGLHIDPSRFKMFIQLKDVTEKPIIDFKKILEEFPPKIGLPSKMGTLDEGKSGEACRSGEVYRSGETRLKTLDKTI